MKQSVVLRLRTALNRRRRSVASVTPSHSTHRFLTLEALDRREVLSASPYAVLLDPVEENGAEMLGTTALVASQLAATTVDTDGIHLSDEAQNFFITGANEAEGENHDEQHIHAKLSIFVNSEQVVIPANIGVTAQQFLSQIHTHDATGEIHIHPIGNELRDTTLTLGDFFEVWRTNAGLAGNNANATFSATNLLGNLANTTDTVQMFVNGEVSKEFEDLVIEDGQQIVLVFGSNPVVSVNTTFGPIPIELFAEETPITVDNFLTYVNDGDYQNSFFHRSVSNFVIQGGGFTTTSPVFSDISQFSAIPTNPPIQNEPGISNLRGTLAMAKVGNDPNSATSQFFVNLSDSNAFLDLPENNSFTVFGQVLDMDAVDRIASLPRNTSNPAPYGELPLSNEALLAVVHTVEGQGRLSGTKFLDANGNGVRDSGESGIANATVFLDANNNGVLDAGEISTTTDAQGRYLFEVEPGTYTVRAIVSSGQELTLPSNANSYTATVEIGRETANRNFGVRSTDNGTTDPPSPNSISGLVYLDANGNGQHNPGEMGVPGSLITLTGTTTQGASITRTAITQDDGVYQFLGLPSGTYQLTQTQSQVLENGTANTAAAGVVAGVNQFSNIVLTGETVMSNLHFGERSLRPEYISVHWYLASSGDDAAILREMMAMGEEASGNAELAAAIRRGDTSLSGSVETEPPATPPDTPPVPENQPPVAQADSYSVAQGEVLTVSAANGVLANDSDPDDDPLTAVLATGASHGSLVLQVDGSFTYTPNSEFTGTDTFTYVAHDGQATSNTATVTINVQGENNAPVAVNDDYVVEVDGALVTSAATGVLANDSDPDGDSLSAELVTDVENGLLFLNADGSFTYLPNTAFVGTDTFTYRASDGDLVSTVAVVTILVQEEEPGEGESSLATFVDHLFSLEDDWLFSVT